MSGQEKCRRMSAAIGAALLLVFLGLPPAGASQTYRFVYDPSGNGSMESGAVTLSAAEALLNDGYDYAALKAGVHSRWFLRPLNLPASILLLPSPEKIIHEYYGHGSVIREFGYKDARYGWSWFVSDPRPSYAISDKLTALGTYEQKQLWLAAGAGASQLYLLDAEKEIYRSGRMKVYDSGIFRAAYSDLSYLKDGLDPARTEGGDGTSWLRNFRTRYGASVGLTESYAGKSRRSLDRAMKFDPCFYWLFYVWAHYFLTGGRDAPAPMLPLGGGIGAAFAPKASLTPSGPENYYYIFLGGKGRLLSLYYRTGKTPEGEIKGGGAEFGPVDLAGLKLTPALDIWTFPGAKDPQLPLRASGRNFQLKADMPLYRSLGLSAKAAYKTKGYLLGYPSHSGFYGYAGASLAF
ncbi:MAG: hypothetical protein NTX59_07225 [Elusimicrobia bacterium]|nr:hypothetical protein [Elusimicrobiota bacterium]